MSNTIELSTRLETLELKIMDLEVTMSELNEVVLRQYRDIERLREDNAGLLKKLDALQDPGPSPSAADEVPPHY